jgi:hypothetical protein
MDLRAAFGDEHHRLADALVGVGAAQLALGHPDLAIDPLEHALRIREAEQGLASGLALARARLAEALWNGGGDRRRARTLAEQALAGFAGEGVAMAHARDEAKRWLATHEIE